ncbi:hypothetical protein JIN77_15280 [Verrucomicrobiaceae bacterium R5-34]|uniref:Transmembrane protein n=1 Tax=Oceaniferula flava TaxID=2800421 RepID=A0AAE2SB37_9BACT|nr:hypothetical protein [Oceaniferula flavus]MBK1832098.1 hypothetical protein [Verrucomicrobiaceae bacterium R5-34]MBK1854182.1 hypothetical protein [Oceaniferula flavus]MBM1135488.1 hypothetical protein [Oceaniferula flavus]
MPQENFNTENFQDVQKLIALKRYEQPDDAYFEEFLDEFHRRQRQDLMHRSSRSLFVERVGTWFSGWNKLNVVYGAGLAYAAFMLAFVLWPKANDPAQLPTAPVKHEVPSATTPLGQAAEDKEEDMLTPDKDQTPHHEAY